MGILTLNTRQYVELMRSIMMAMTVDAHVAILDARNPDEDIANLWETCMNAAEDFGMSFAPEDSEAPHWSTDMAAEAHDDVHVLLGAAQDGGGEGSEIIT